MRSTTSTATTTAIASKAFKTTLPIFMAFLPLGLAFGFIAQELGMPWYGILMLSCLVYAGSSEFVAVAMMAAGEPISAIVFTSFLVNFRHVFYGLSILDKIPAKGLLRYYVIGTLSDETFALIASATGQEKSFSIWIAFFNHIYWFGSVVAGYMLHSGVDLKLPGLEFVLTALFVVLTIEQAKKLQQALPFVVAIICGGITLAVIPEQMLVIAVILSAVTLCIVSLQRKKEVNYAQ